MRRQEHVAEPRTECGMLDQIEADLTALVNANIDLGDDDLQWRCEQSIRNYDPCISCATHFLKLEVERR